jgi:N-acetylmuramic acid 6-phosphate etherase
MATFTRITEQDSKYRQLQDMSVLEVLTSINNEDQTVPHAVAAAINDIEKVVSTSIEKMLQGGRLIYIGAGTSGRLGIVDASECPPTYGVPYGLVIGIIAGGSHAITNAVENAEDDPNQGWLDLQAHNICDKDVVIGLSAAAKFPIEVVVGPEFVTGSTRMKSGTAQKLVLNMISTAVMIGLGRVEDNKMVNMQLTNEKLVDRGVHMLMKQINSSDYEVAKALLLQHGSVKKATDVFLGS